MSLDDGDNYGEEFKDDRSSSSVSLSILLVTRLAHRENGVLRRETQQLTLGGLTLIALAKKSAYFRNVIRQGEVITLDLTTPDLDISLSSFMRFLRYVETNRIEAFTSEILVDEWHRLLLFLGLDEDVEADLAFPQFENYLLPQDQGLRLEEQELRVQLFGQEELDQRSVDANYLMTTACERQGFELDLQPRGQAPPLAHLSLEGNQEATYWGLFGGGGGGRNWDTSDISNRGLDHVMIGGDYPLIGKSRPLLQVKNRFPHFKEYFDQVTNGLFTDFDFTDCCLAGGSVFQLLTGYYAQTHYALNQEGNFRVNDFDFFILTKDPEKANIVTQRLLDLALSVEDSIEDSPPLILRTEYSLTVATYNFKLQVITRLYNSVTQIISGFDLDSVAVAYDGRDLYCMDRFVRVLKTGYNLADPDRQSTSYVYRLIKYIRRGIAIALPGYDQSKALSAALQLENPTGLTKLIKGVRTYFSRTINTFTIDGMREAAVAVPDDQLLTDESDYGLTVHNLTTFTEVLYALRREAYRAANLSGLGRGDGDEEIFGEPLYRLDVADAIGKVAAFLVARGVKLPYQLYQNTDQLFSGDPEAAFKISTVLPPEVEYRTRNPGGQTTNSFKPTSENWLYDLYALELDSSRYVKL